MARSPDLVPSYRNVFFSRYYTLVELVLFTGRFLLLLVHEAFHALAGRGLGLRSRLSVGRRLNYLVLETSLDRAGGGASPAALPADARRHGRRHPGDQRAHRGRGAHQRHRGPAFLFGRICLALAFMTVLRFV